MTTIAHEGPAYNRDLAEAGYDVEITSRRRQSVDVVSSKTMYYKKDLIVAYQLNGETLPEEYWPLRLVGEGIEAADMVGQIAEIKALVPGRSRTGGRRESHRLRWLPRGCFRDRCCLGGRWSRRAAVLLGRLLRRRDGRRRERRPAAARPASACSSPAA